MENKNDLIVRDWLAIERTRLANERTFLSYVRTTLIFLGSGLSLMKIELFEEYHNVGLALAISSPLILGFGIYRLFAVRKKIKQHYNR